MDLKELIDYITKNYGIFGTYLIGTELKTFGNLPSMPDGYMFPKLNCDKDIENVKNIIKIENTEIDKLYPNSDNKVHLTLDDYESRCFLTMLLFENVFNYWCGKNTKIKYDSTNDSHLADFDNFTMELWNWIRDEISTEQLKYVALNFKKAVKK